MNTVLKKFSVGNWFPGKVPVNELQNPIQSEMHQRGPKTVYSPFLIVPSPNQEEKVIVIRGGVSGPGSGPVFAPQSDQDPLNSTNFSWGNDLYLNVDLSNGEVTGCSIDTSADTIGAGKAVIYLGSVSSTGVIQRMQPSDGFVIFACGDNNFATSLGSQ